MDLPVWQELREELKDKNFEVIAVACDTPEPSLSRRTGRISAGQ